MDSDVAQLPLSDRLLAWFEANKKQALWGAVILVAAGLVVGFLAWRKGENEIEAGKALSAVSVPQNAGVGNRTDAPEAYLKIASDFPNTKTAPRALLLAAGEYFAQGKYDQAKTLFEKFRREHGDSPLTGQALLGIAGCLEGQKKTAEALAAYKELIERRPNDSAVPQAKFALANLHETENRPEQAFALFEDIVRSDPYGSLGSEAGMRAEELKQKHPKLAQALAPPTVPTPMAPFPVPGASNAPKVIVSTNPAATGSPSAPVPSLPNPLSATNPPSAPPKK